MIGTPNTRMAVVAAVIFFFDQVTKWSVLRFLNQNHERIVIDGFFKFVHWGNTGAAWSLFKDKNEYLAIVSLVALLALFLFRRHFDTHTLWGQLALGLIFGGILGNLYDRLFREHVIDFIRFYLHRRGGDEIGFPAFNIADSAICVGVGLLFILSWRQQTDGSSRPEAVR